MELINRFIVIVDNDSTQPSDAIILLEGDGFNRYQKAADLYKAKYSKRIVFSGGSSDLNYGSFPFDEVCPFLLREGIPKSDIIHEGNSKNTWQQAYEVVKLAVNNNWSKIILVASNYHQYRAYLTFLKANQELNGNLIIYNEPVRNLSWFNEMKWGNRFKLLEQEFIKIEEYSKLGHLCNFEEAINYQRWKESQQ